MSFALIDPSPAARFAQAAVLPRKTGAPSFAARLPASAPVHLAASAPVDQVRFSARRPAAANGKLIVVANRESYAIKPKAGGGYQLAVSAGGLVAGMSPALGKGDLWIAREVLEDGIEPFDRIPELVKQLPPEEAAKLPSHDIAGVRLSKADADAHYNKIANGLLWPVMHNYLEGVGDFSKSDWMAYRSVNQKFADAIVRQSGDQDRIWVQDYQLMLVPGQIRAQAPGRNIGFFCHIPFPSDDILSVVPQKKEILRGLLGADLLGFHVPTYVDHFLQSVARTLPDEARVDFKAKTVHYQGRVIQVGDFPISIDPGKIRSIQNSPGYSARLQALRRQYPEPYLGVAVDRLDYSKGIYQRLKAIEALLDADAKKPLPVFPGRFKFIQIAAPSRQDVPAYQALERKVIDTVTAINRKCRERSGNADWTPIELIHRDVPFDQIVPLMQLSRFGLITPIKDGMNLVAKEYCVAQDLDDPGVLILSELAGAAHELGGARMVNPFNQESMTEAIAWALDASRDERRAQMTPLQAQVLSHDVHQWRNRFLSRFDQCVEKNSRRQAMDQMLADIQTAVKALPHPPLWCFDYDGTLTPIVDRPENARLSRTHLAGLRRWQETHRDRPLVLISGRPVAELWSFIQGLDLKNLIVAGLHGGEIWSGPADAWLVRPREEDRWTIQAMASAMADFERRYPGVQVENKQYTLALHVRNAESPLVGEAALQAFEALVNRQGLLGAFQLKPGKKVLELAPVAFNKGKALETIVESLKTGTGRNYSPVMAGDDRTDEDAFAQAHRMEGSSIGIGQTPTGASVARHRLPSVGALYRFFSHWR